MLLSDLEPDQAYRAIHLANLILEAFEGGAWAVALDEWLNAEISNDERIVVWGFIDDSRQRAFLKGEDRKYIEEFYR